MAYDQRREDPKGFYASLAVICGLVALGAFVAGGSLMFFGLVSGAAAVSLAVAAQRQG